MEIYLTIIQFFILFTAVMTIVGITIHDIRLVRSATNQRHGRRRGRKPLVSIVVDDDVSDESIKSLRKSDYRKKEIVFVGERPRGDLILYLPKNDTIDPGAISRAVNSFTADSQLATAELVPVISRPTTLWQFFCMYQNIALAPFTSVRIAYRITTLRSRWPLMIRPELPGRPHRARLYRLIRWLSSVFNATLFAYVLYLAVWLYEPIFLMAYLGFFGIWMIMAIWHLEDFSRRQKIIYIALSPASLGYFTLLAFIVPIRPLFRIVSHVAAALSLRSSRQHAA